MSESVYGLSLIANAAECLAAYRKMQLAIIRALGIPTNLLIGGAQMETKSRELVAQGHWNSSYEIIHGAGQSKQRAR